MGKTETFPALFVPQLPAGDAVLASYGTVLALKFERITYET